MTKRVKLILTDISIIAVVVLVSWLMLYLISGCSVGTYKRERIMESVRTLNDPELDKLYQRSILDGIITVSEYDEIHKMVRTIEFNNVLKREEK